MFDFNYTLSKSEDLGSQVERGSAFGNSANGGYSGFLINSFDPESNYGTSDFDVRHQLNTNWLADLPFGQGKKCGSNANAALNALIGDWSLAGVWRMTSGFPFNVYNCRSCWATNWNLQGNAMLVDPEPPAARPRPCEDAVDGRPSPFENATDALTYFRRALPGEVGIRNQLRGDGYFVIDLSLSKSFRTGISDHRLRFRWDTFNVTNTREVRRRSAQHVPGSRRVRPLRRHRWRPATRRPAGACSSRFVTSSKLAAARLAACGPLTRAAARGLGLGA